jgi:hypothetical protein
MAAPVAPILDADGRRLCGLCRTRPVSLANVRRRIYRCQSCHNARNAAAAARYRRSDRNRASQARYRRSPHGFASRKEKDARRLRVGHRHYGMARTRDEAVRLKAYIRKRMEGYVAQQRLEARAQMESLEANAVRVSATLSTDRL